MKLYTEEQVRELVRKTYCGDFYDNDTPDDLVNELTPIELPSDDDICDEAESIAHNYFVMQRNHYQGLEEGAKRMAYWLMKNFEQKDNGK
jgi:hypothetical protein